MTGITSRYCQNETVSNLTVVRSGTVYTVAKLVEWVTFDNKYMRNDIGKAIDEI
jgi:hypothetical protein